MLLDTMALVRILETCPPRFWPPGWGRQSYGERTMRPRAEIADAVRAALAHAVKWQSGP